MWTSTLKLPKVSKADPLDDPHDDWSEFIDQL